MKRREKELERERERKTRERSIWKERVHRETRVMRVRRGGRRRGSRVAGITDAGIADAKVPQTRGSRPAFKSGHEENTDAGIISVSCRHERDTDAGLDSALRRYKNAKAALNRCQEHEDSR